MTKTYDLIIIGAGSVGVPTAFAAARAGLKTLVIDRRSSPGQGENKGAIGGIRATHSDPAKIMICLRSIKFFSEWEEKTGVRIGWKAIGYLFPIYRWQDEKMMKGLLAIQKPHGLNIDWIGPDVVRELVPGIKEEGLRGGTFSPGDGRASPLLAVNAFYFAAKGAGAEFKFNEKVTSIEIANGNVRSVTTDRETYATASVLNAAGSDASEIGKMAGLELPVFPDSHEAGITEPVRPFFQPLVVDIRPTPGGKNCYFYQNADDRMEFCLTPDPIFPGQNRESTSTFLPLVTRRLVDILPKLANIRVRRIWRGCYPQTPDGMPIVGRAENADGSFFAVGMCGQGFMLGPGLAEDLVELITKGQTVTDASFMESFSLHRKFDRTAEALK